MTPAAIAIVFRNEKKEVLAVKRNDVPIWVLPGGGIDADETPEMAVVREVLEETGYAVSIVRKTGYYTPINKFADVTHVYECRMESGQPRINEEAEEITFFPTGKLPDDFFVVHRDWLQDALKNPDVTVEKPITQVTIWNIMKYFLQHPWIVVRFLWRR